MSSDVAVLGLKIDSSSADSAAKSLSNFAASAATAGAAADKLSVAGGKSSAATKAIQQAATPAVQAMVNMTKAANDSGKAHSGLSSQALAASHSVRSFVEALASGQPISMALSQQLGHLSYVAQGPAGISGAFREATSSLMAFVSPTGLVVGGLAAVAAGGVLVYNSIAKTEKAFDDTSRAAGVTIGQLHDLAAAASFKGIDSDEFLKSMDKFAGDVYQAQHNMGGLADTFRANNVHAKDFDDYLLKASDLIKNAASDQQRLQLLQAMGLPATMDWVRFLSQGSDGIRQATAEATKFGDTADEAMVRKAREFDEAWAKSITNFSNGFKSGFVEVLGYFDKVNSAVNSLLSKAGVNVGKNLLTNAMIGGPTAGTTLTQSSANEFYKSVGTAAPFNAAAGAGKSLVPADIKTQIALAQPPLGLFGQTPTAKQAEKEKDDSDNLRRAA